MRTHAGEKTHSCNKSDKYFSLNSILIDVKHHYTVGPTKFLKVVKKWAEFETEWSKVSRIC